MRTSWVRRCSLGMFLALTLMATDVVHAHHTTDHTQQQLEQERQQREYWRAQEQRRQEEQRLRQIEQETVRRREDQAERDRRQYQQRQSGGSGQANSPDQSGTLPQRSTVAQPGICKSKPVASGERNPLVGRWQYTENRAAQQNLFGQIFQMACPHYAGGFDFRDRSLIAQGKPVPASYGRDGDVWWVCGNGVALAFRPQGPDRLQMVDPTPNCMFERAGGVQR